MKIYTETTIVAGSISPLHALQLIFITLKLCHVIDWSWWCVLIPLWFLILWAGIHGQAKAK